MTRQNPDVLRDLARVAIAYQRLERSAFAELGELAETGCRVLAELLPSRGMSISALAQRVGSDRPWVSQVVERMRVAGLVERAEDPEDRRRVRVVLTASGRRSAARLRTALQEQVARRLSRLPAGRREIVMQAIPALAEALDPLARNGA